MEVNELMFFPKNYTGNDSGEAVFIEMSDWHEYDKATGKKTGKILGKKVSVCMVDNKYAKAEVKVATLCNPVESFKTGMKVTFNNLQSNIYQETKLSLLADSVAICPTDKR